MAAQIRVLRRRIRSTQSIKKITRAMELIATSRIVKARARVQESRPYAEQITAVLTELASNAALDHPLLVERENPRRAAVLVVTSDRGQAGGYNNNVLKEAEALYSLLREEGKEPVIYVIGRKGVNYYRFRNREVEESWTGFSEQPTYPDAAEAARTLVEAFMADDGRREQRRRAAPGVHAVQEHGHADAAGAADGAHGRRVRREDESPSGGSNRCTSSSPTPTRCSTRCCPSTSGRGCSRRCWSPRPRSRPTASAR